MKRDGHVLLVEDDFLIRACLTEFLEDSGLVVIEADSVAEATAGLDADDAVAIVITDLSLPDGDGHQVVAHARERSPDMPVIFLSGMIEHGRHAPDTRTLYIPKPYAMADVLAAVHGLTQGDTPTQ